MLPRASHWSTTTPVLPLVALWLVAAQWAEQLGAAWVFQRPAWAAGAWWQLFTAQWVHFGWGHAMANVLALALMGTLFHRRVAASALGLALCGGMAGVAAVLWWDSACQYYAGASGALHGVWAGGALAWWWRGSAPSSPSTNPVASWWGAALLALLAGKLAVQHVQHTGPLVGALEFAVYTPAHVAGALGGLLAVAATRLASAAQAARAKVR